MNAGLPFTDRCTQDGAYCTATADRQHIRNRVRRNDYGFTFGGPVRIPKLYDGRNKTFFFVNFEQFRQDNVNVKRQSTTVPTLAYRTGDFSTALCNSYMGGAAGGGRYLYALSSRNSERCTGSGPGRNRPLCRAMIFDPYTTRLGQRPERSYRLIPTT